MRICRASVSVALLALLLFTTSANARQLRHEPYYAALWCAEQGGRSEVRLASGNRADCITETHAIEVDWARKFRQGIGQSLDYAQETGKRAGILLLLRDERDYRYWIRLNTVIEYHQLPIDTWFRLVED